MAGKIVHGNRPPGKPGSGRPIDRGPLHPIGGGNGPKPRPSRANPHTAINRAVSSVTDAILSSNPQFDHGMAQRLARVILTRPGVKIGAGKQGSIFYQGKRFTPQAFAASPIAKLATGQTAATRNQAAITGSPDYIQALASLGLARDQSTAGLQDQQRQTLIQYGDPSFAQGDALTAGAAAANPFSTANLERQAYQNQSLQARQNANRLGTGAGGGAISGQNEAQRQYAGNVQDAVTKLQALLGQISSQEAAAGQTYDQGKAQAATDAYNTLLASGYHAAQAPSWAVGQFKVRPVAGSGKGGGNNGVKGFGGVGAIGAPGGPPWRPVQPQPPYNGGNPPRPTSPPTLGNPLQPIDMNTVLRRYGIYG